MEARRTIVEARPTIVAWCALPRSWRRATGAPSTIVEARVDMWVVGAEACLDRAARLDDLGGSRIVKACPAIVEP